MSAVSSLPVGRKPGKAKPGKPYRLNLVLPGELVIAVDGLSEKLKEENRGLPVTRTDAIRMLLDEAIKAREGGK